jgi:glucose-1-phosphate thymidylyltransferase
MRGVILAGGHGTRMYCATKTTNKHLLPVYTSEGAIPMIEYPIATLIDLGITDILIITSKEHCGIITEYLGDGYDKGVSFTYKIQEMNDPKRPAGIASALKLAKGFTNDENFVVILGDNYFEYTHVMREDIQWLNSSNCVKCGLFLKEVENWKQFGVAELTDEGEPDTEVYIKRIVEKPKTFISPYAVTGMYWYTPDVYQYIETLKPSERGELEISHINDMYVNKGLTHHTILDTFWSDMGSPESMLDVQKYINE